MVVPTILGVVKSEKLYLQVAEKILQAISVGTIAQGDKLPQERSLATSLGVSRPTVREALAALEIIGVIEVKPGVGTIVRQTTPNISQWAEKIGAPPEEIIEAREVCEEGVVRLLCRQDTAPNFEPLHVNLQQTSAAHETNNVDEFLIHSLAFHPLLASATQNAVLEHIMSELTSLQTQPLFTLLNKLAMTVFAHREEQYLDHVHLLEAIQQRDEDKAFQLVYKHLDILREFMLGDFGK